MIVEACQLGNVLLGGLPKYGFVVVEVEAKEARGSVFTRFLMEAGA